MISIHPANTVNRKEIGKSILIGLESLYGVHTDHSLYSQNGYIISSTTITPDDSSLRGHCLKLQTFSISF